MVTMLILAMTMFYIFLLFTRGFIVLKRADQRLIMTKLAQSIMEDAVANPGNYTGGKSGNFSSEGFASCQYSVISNNYAVGGQTLYQLQVSVYDNTAKPPINISLVNIISN